MLESYADPILTQCIRFTRWSLHTKRLQTKTIGAKNEKGERHREDGPAVEYADGSKYWYQNGELHREDGPAIEDEEDGSKDENR